MNHKVPRWLDSIFGLVGSYGIAVVFLIFSGLMAWKFGTNLLEKLVWVGATSILEISVWYQIPRVKHAWEHRHDKVGERNGKVLYRSFVQHGLSRAVVTASVQVFSLVAAVFFSINSINTATLEAQASQVSANVQVDTSAQDQAIQLALSDIDVENRVIGAQMRLLSDDKLAGWERSEATVAINRANAQKDQDLKKIQTAQAEKAQRLSQRSSVKVDSSSQVDQTFQQVAGFLNSLTFGWMHLTGPSLLVGLFLFAFLALQLTMWLTWEPYGDVPSEAKTEAAVEAKVEEKILFRDISHGYAWEEMEKYLQTAIPDTGDRMLPDYKVSEQTGIPLETCEHFKRLLKMTQYKDTFLVTSKPGETRINVNKESAIRTMKFLYNVKVADANATKE